MAALLFASRIPVRTAVSAPAVFAVVIGELPGLYCRDLSSSGQRGFANDFRGAVCVSLSGPNARTGNPLPVQRKEKTVIAAAKTAGANRPGRHGKAPASEIRAPGHLFAQWPDSVGLQCHEQRRIVTQPFPHRKLPPRNVLRTCPSHGIMCAAIRCRCNGRTIPGRRRTS